MSHKGSNIFPSVHFGWSPGQLLLEQTHVWVVAISNPSAGLFVVLVFEKTENRPFLKFWLNLKLFSNQDIKESPFECKIVEDRKDSRQVCFIYKSLFLLNWAILLSSINCFYHSNCLIFQQERRNERFTDLILRGDGLKKASVGREAVFTINSKQVSFFIFNGFKFNLNPCRRLG